MLEAPGDGRVEPRGGRGLKRVAGAGDVSLVAERSGMAEQKPRIELGRVDAAVAQAGRGRDEGLAQGQRLTALASSCMAESWEVWCSVISASMISSSASPPSST